MSVNIYYRNIITKIYNFENELIKKRRIFKTKGNESLQNFLKMLEYQSEDKTTVNDLNLPSPPIDKKYTLSDFTSDLSKLEIEIMAERRGLFRGAVGPSGKYIEYKELLSDNEKKELLKSFNNMLKFEYNKGLEGTNLPGLFESLTSYTFDPWIKQLEKYEIPVTIRGSKQKKKTKSKKSKSKVNTKSKKKSKYKSKKKSKVGGKSKKKSKHTKSKKSKRYAKK